MDGSGDSYYVLTRADDGAFEAVRVQDFYNFRVVNTNFAYSILQKAKDVMRNQSELNKMQQLRGHQQLTQEGEDVIDVDLTAADRSIWLVKIPKYVSDRWNDYCDGAILGDISITKYHIF